jgi:Ca-activated chloride channel family protein
MSFAAPAVLLGLLALPLAAAWYAAEQRRRRTAATAFATPALQPSVAPRAPGWRRHAPALAFLLALAILVMAAARPQRTVAVPVERATIVLATDVSGSMTATDVQPSRLVAAQNAARRLVSEVPKRVNVGIVAFNSTPHVLQAPTQDRQAIEAAIKRMAPSGGTAAG